MTTEHIKEDADYEGVRVRFVGLLGKARIAMEEMTEFVEDEKRCGQ